MTDKSKEGQPVSTPHFWVGGQVVNAQGQTLDDDGQPVKADGPADDGQLATVTSERDTLKQQLATVTGERDAARQAVQDGKLVPDDLLARVKAVRGVGDALADAIVTAVTAPAGG